MTRKEDRTSLAQAICFFPFRLDVATEQLWRGVQLLAVRPKTFAVLRYLVEHPDRLVTRDELRQAVWPETVGSERAPKQCMRELRQVLGEETATPRFIETLGRRGWRFIGQVVSSQHSVVSSPLPPPQDSGLRTQNSSALAPNPQPPTPALVGRETELVQLHGWLAKALHGEHQIVFVTGEPGIGKTSLLEAFLAEVGAARRGRPTLEHAPTQEIWVTYGQCIEQHGAGEAFLPVLDALGRLARGAEGAQLIALLRTYAPLWLVQLPAFLEGEELETLHRKVQGASRERMLRELAEALERLTAEQPVMLVLEDLHWSDVSTLDLLAFLARRKEAARLLVIGTYRPVEMLNDGHPLQGITQELYAHQLATELPLGLLSEADIAAYLDERFNVTGTHSDDEWCHSEPQRSASEESHATKDYTQDSSASGLRMTTLGADGGSPFRNLAHLLHHRTGGNPLFLVSTVEELVAQGNLTQTDHAWTLQGEVADVGIAESIRHLVARQRGRLSAEERYTLEAASIAGMEFSAAAVAAALTADTATIERRCEQLAQRQQFLHRLGIEEWPDGTLAARYSFLHAVYQQLWHEQVSPTQLQHYHLCIGERKEHAYGEQAREIATELAIHFEQGRDYPRAVQYLQQAGKNAVRRSAHQEASTHLTKGLELLKLLPDTPERAQQELRLLKPLGPALVSTKGYAAAEVEHTYARAYKLCQQGSRSQQLIEVLPGLWAFYLMRGEVRKARDLAEQGWQLAQGISTPTTLILAHAFLGESLFSLGELAAAREHFEQGWGLYNPQEHNPHVIPHWIDPGVALLSDIAMILWWLGYADQAQQRLQESLVLVEGRSHPFSLAFALMNACSLHSLRQEWQRARDRAEEVIRLSTEQGLPYWLADGTAARGRALVAQGEAEEGLAQMQQGLAVFRAIGTETTRVAHLPWLAAAYGRVGRVEEGLAVLAEALALVNNTGFRVGEAGLYVLKGWLLLACTGDNQGEADACFRQAVDIARRQSAKFIELRAMVSLARLWRQQGKRQEARCMLAEIYNWFTEGFATKDLQEAKALLTKLS